MRQILSPAYRVAVHSALKLQVPVAILLLLMLDNGMTARIGGCVMAGFWLGVAAVMIRRPWTPTRLDLVFIRLGYIPLLVLGIWMQGVIANFCG